MSMIFICQSNEDLSSYELKNVRSVGMTYTSEMLNILDFSERSWSNDTFGVLWDESINEMNPLLHNKSFSSTNLFSFLSSIIDFCEKIAIFHCRPMPKNSDWNCFERKDDFYKAVEDALKNGVPYTYEKTLIYKNVISNVDVKHN